MMPARTKVGRVPNVSEKLKSVKGSLDAKSVIGMANVKKRSMTILGTLKPEEGWDVEIGLT